VYVCCLVDDDDDDDDDGDDCLGLSCLLCAVVASTAYYILLTPAVCRRFQLPHHDDRRKWRPMRNSHDPSSLLLSRLTSGESKNDPQSHVVLCWDNEHGQARV
jgi:hypothetical protein